MPRLPRKRILVKMFTTGIAFLLLALSFSRDDDMCSPAFLVVAWRVMHLSTASRWNWDIPCCVKGCIDQLVCYVRPCTGVAHHIVFVFNIMQPPPAIKPFNLKLLKTIFDFPNCLLVCGNPGPKSASLGWDFGSSCSVGGLLLSCGSTCVSSCCLVVGVYSVVAASP